MVSMRKSDVVRHATRPSNEASHQNFDKRTDAIFLENITNYYNHIGKIQQKDLHKTAQRFLSNVMAASNTSNASTSTAPSSGRKRGPYFTRKSTLRPDHKNFNKRKRTIVRQAPPHVPCISRYINFNFIFHSILILNK